MSEEEDKGKEERLADAVKRRSVVRAAVTRTINKAEKVLSLDDSWLDSPSRAEAETCAGMLKDKIGLLEELDAEVQAYVADEKLEAESQECHEYSFKARKCLTLLKRVFAPESVVSNAAASGSQRADLHVKLPKRKLPVFNGTVAGWQPFWDQFDSSIHSNRSLSEVEKFNYLLDSLSDAAKSSIRGLAVTSVNYRTAVDILTERFGKSDLIVADLMNQLSDIRLSDTSLTGLQRFYDDINAATRSLENQGIAASSYEALLLPSLLRRCPVDFRVELHRLASLRDKEIDSVQSLLDCLKREISVRETAGQQRISRPSFQGAPGSAPRNRFSMSTASTLVAVQSNSVGAPGKVFCTYCKAPHASELCTQVVSVDKRRKILISEKRCFRCLRPGHTVRECSDTRTCRSCSGKHHVSVCSPESSRVKSASTWKMSASKFPGGRSQCGSGGIKSNATAQKVQDNQCLTTTSDGSPDGAPGTAPAEAAVQVPPKPDDGAAGESVVMSMFLSGNPAVALPVAKAVLLSPDGRKEMVVRVLLDTASNRSYIRQDVCDTMGIKSDSTEKLSVSTFAGLNTHIQSGSVNLSIRKVDSLETVQLKANVVENICQPQRSVLVSAYQHLKSLDLADPYDPRDRSTPISILVGSDFYYQLVGDEVVRGVSGPVAISSKLGYLLCGPLTVSASDSNDGGVSRDSDGDGGSADTSLVCCFAGADVSTSAGVDFTAMWRLDSIGILEDPSPSDDSFFPCDLQFRDGRYSARLPWSYPKSAMQLNDHFDMSLRRLRSTMRRLEGNPEQLEQCDAIISEQEKLGIIEKVPAADTTSKAELLHYLPHSCVVKAGSENTKLRIVFDGSAKASSTDFSINDFLECGPTNFPLIPQILLRFRLKPIAVLADIEKAFLQIAIDERDRDSLRFLWTEGRGEEQRTIVHYRFCRVPFGLTCSPGILRATILHHLESFKEKSPDVVKPLKEDLYVDNLITSCDSVEQALELYRQTKSIFSKAGMNMRQWQSNSVQFTEGLPPKDVSKASKVLGVAWDAERDAFEFEFRSLVESVISEKHTKRSLLSVLSKMFDPHGFLAPAVTLVKVWFQQLCVRKVSWDEGLPSDIATQWVRWLSSLKLTRLEVPRYVIPDNQGQQELQLHGFSDASERAYAAVVYLRVIDHDRQSTSAALLMSKSRVAPLASVSIARLELLGALILARLMNFISLQFPGLVRYLWTDSMNTFQWITQEAKLRQIFVQNRVNEIRRLTSVTEWRHVPGEYNPADLPSRGCLPEKLMDNSVWWFGPSFFQQYQCVDIGDMDFARDFGVKECDASVDINSSCAQSDSSVSGKVVATNAANAEDGSLLEVIVVSNYSSFSRLVRVIGWVIRFVKNLRAAVSKTTSIREPALRAKEVDEAEDSLLKAAQQESFSSELSHFHGDGPRTALIRDLRLFLDDAGLIRSAGRIEAAVPFATNNPVLIPPKSHLESLIIRQSHSAIFHGGVSATLCKVRERFWILKARQRIKKVLSSCVVCRKVQGRPFTVKQVAQLPSFRLSAVRAFSTVGLDYAGPIFYRTGEIGVAEKSYILLFTCSATRAVHLELVKSMDGDQLLHALRRFVARRGIPSVVSDNARTFRATARLIDAKITEELQSFCADKKISWNFVPERAPWWGGFWERLIGVVKTALKKAVGRQLFTFDQLITLIVEIEAVVNCRPLLYVSSGDSIDVITPSHFLCCSRLTEEPSSVMGDEMLLPLPQRLKNVRAAVDWFWMEWKTAYLESLREKSQRSSPEGRAPRVGDVVQVVGEARQPRLRWKLGLVEELRTGRDGVVRSVVVRLAGVGDSRRWECVRRPVQALVPLEIDASG